MVNTESDDRLNMLKSTPSQLQEEALARKTNQDIINAAYKVADQLKLKGGP